MFRLRLPSFAKVDPGLASVAHEYPAHVWSKLGKTFRTAMAGVTKNYLGAPRYELARMLLYFVFVKKRRLNQAVGSVGP